MQMEEEEQFIIKIFFRETGWMNFKIIPQPDNWSAIYAARIRLVSSKFWIIIRVSDGLFIAQSKRMPYYG